MNILYLVSVMKKNSGKGGHYYSLRTTAEAINKKVGCSVVVIGNKESPVINHSKLKVYNLVYEKIHLIQVIKDLRKVINIECPDVIHSFDEGVFFFGNLMSIIYKKPYIHTKCGGGNPKIALAKVNNLILYSQENLKYYQSSKRFKNTKIYHIPNRVGVINQNYSKIQSLKLAMNYDGSSKIFLIISRIDGSKKYDILQAMNLISKLNHDGVKAKLIIVGNIHDKDVGDEIKGSIDNDTFLFTDDEYTINASELIDAADFVVGGGRSFMEAASRGKIMLCPIKDSKYPLLITKDNFDEALNKNFSHRLTINDFNSSENYKKITRALTDQNYAVDISRYIKSVSNKHFEISSQLNTYCDIYKNTKWKLCSNFFDMIAIYYIRFIKNN